MLTKERVTELIMEQGYPAGLASSIAADVVSDPKALAGYGDDQEAEEGVIRISKRMFPIFKATGQIDNDREYN